MAKSTTVSRRWTREELIAALALYSKVPFRQFVSSNSEVVHLAKKIDRTPSSVSMKLCNFASLDPAYREQGIKGLENASDADREIFQQYSSNIGRILEDSEWSRFVFEDGTDSSHCETSSCVETEGTREIKFRKGQQAFRKAVLTAYQDTCAVSGIKVPDLLVASHIIPWSVDESRRLDARNGIALSSLHDKAFDHGLISIDSEYNVLVSSRLKNESPGIHLKTSLLDIEGQRITMPERFWPDEYALRWHRENVFKG